MTAIEPPVCPFQFCVDGRTVTHLESDADGDLYECSDCRRPFTA